jgi:hypothetical protein
MTPRKGFVIDDDSDVCVIDSEDEAAWGVAKATSPGFVERQMQPNSVGNPYVDLEPNASALAITVIGRQEKRPVDEECEKEKTRKKMKLFDYDDNWYQIEMAHQDVIRRNEAFKAQTTIDADRDETGSKSRNKLIAEPFEKSPPEDRVVSINKNKVKKTKIADDLNSLLVYGVQATDDQKCPIDNDTRPQCEMVRVDSDAGCMFTDDEYKQLLDKIDPFIF